MSKVISKSQLPIVRIALTKAINDALAKIDPELIGSLGNIRFTPGQDFRVKLEVRTKPSGVNLFTPVAGAIKGIEIGQKWLNKGYHWTVVDYKPRNYRYPFIVERYKARGIGTKRFKVSASWFNTAQEIAR